MFVFISINSFWRCKNMGSIIKNIFNEGIIFKVFKVIEINIVYGIGLIFWIYRVIMKYENDKIVEV